MSNDVTALLERAAKQASAYRESFAASPPRRPEMPDALRGRFCGPTPSRRGAAARL